MRASDAAFITKILQMCCRNTGTAAISCLRTYFSAKKAKKEPKSQTYFLRPTNLKRGQISEIWPKKGQPDNLGTIAASGNHKYLQ